MDERPRTAQMKRWLDDHADEIECSEYGQVRFDWGPGDVKTFIGKSGVMKARAPTARLESR